VDKPVEKPLTAEERSRAKAYSAEQFERFMLFERPVHTTEKQPKQRRFAPVDKCIKWCILCAGAPLD
jgi:hypothetical protein